MSSLLRSTYRAAGFLVNPLLQHYLKKRAQRGKEDANRLHERFGHAGTPRPHGTLIWIHAASVGEMQSVLTLIERITATYPALHVLITTGTVTSARMLEERALPQVIHQFVPVDTYVSVKRFLDHWHPDIAMWVESEFWPELLHQTQSRGIPTLLVNARMSQKSAEAWQRLPSIITALINGFNGVFASTTEDANRLRTLGSPNIIATGNLKFDAPPLPADDAALEHFTHAIQGRPALLFASTHEGEETIIAHVVRALQGDYPNLLCVMVPRHAARGDSIASMLHDAKFQVAQRSHQQSITAATQIYLADTMGELGLFFRACNIVCMGGSLIAHGGHNLLEPARLHCAIITGKHMHNFADITARMQNTGALIVTENAETLAADCAMLLGNPEKQLNLAQKAWQFATESQGAADAVMATLATHLKQAA